MGINKLLKNKSIFNNGFAITSMIYLILVMAIILVTLSLAILNNRHLILDKQKDKSFDNIYSKDSAIKEINYLMTSSSISSAETTFLGGMILRSKVESITIVDNKEVPSNVIGSWDVSEKQNGSIMAWYIDSDSNNMYELYIGEEGGVKANLDSSYLFQYFIGLKNIDLEYLNTNNVTNMSGMFHYCTGLKSLDLKNFNTSNVTNMTGMFVSCIGITSIDMRNATFSNVTSYENMFSGAYIGTIYVKDTSSQSFINERISDAVKTGVTVSIV